jgi:hypothetical protein
MSRFRVGIMESLIYEDTYVIQKKAWWGWYTWAEYYWEENARDKAKQLEREGHKVEWHI